MLNRRGEGDVLASLLIMEKFPAFHIEGNVGCHVDIITLSWFSSISSFLSVFIMKRVEFHELLFLLARWGDRVISPLHSVNVLCLMHHKTTARCNFTPIWIPVFEKQNKCWWGCGETGTFVH
jgi:hypothetical protein